MNIAKTFSLVDLMECATGFCRAMLDLDRRSVDSVAWNHTDKEYLNHSDARDFLMISYISAERFAQKAHSLVKSLDFDSLPYMRSLQFQMDAGQVLWDGTIAVLRIFSQSNKVGADSSLNFKPLALRPSFGDSFSHGSEGHLTLLALHLEKQSKECYRLAPRVRLSYTVEGQQSLSIFLDVLKESNLRGLFDKTSHFTVHTSVTITKDERQNVSDDEWCTSDDIADVKAITFCEYASKIDEDLTDDAAPKIVFWRDFDITNTEDDFQACFGAVLALSSQITECAVEDQKFRDLMNDLYKLPL